MNYPPSYLPVRPEQIPAAMIDLHRWVCWRPEWKVNAAGVGTWAKVPRRPDGRAASSTDPAMWSTFDAALSAHQSGSFPGIGWVLRPPYAGIDFDDCFNAAGELLSDMRRWVEALDSYTEVSVSGTGLHILVHANLPPFGHKAGPMEAYSHGRYFTVSGHRWLAAPAGITERAEQVQAFCAEQFGGAVAGFKPAAPLLAAPNDLGDQELIERAARAANGPAFARLWAGDASGHRGDASRADAALVAHLLFWTGGDRARADRLFRQSGLFRAKWDERHYGTGETYGAHLVATLAAGLRGVYEPVRLDGTGLRVRDAAALVGRPRAVDASEAATWLP